MASRTPENANVEAVTWSQKGQRFVRIASNHPYSTACTRPTDAEPNTRTRSAGVVAAVAHAVPLGHCRGNQ